MGLVFTRTYLDNNRPPYLPDCYEKPSFDPNLGFEAPRKKREMKISEQEMKALDIPKNKRDYCAHLYKDYLVCLRQYSFYGMCNPEKHAYEHCQIEDYTLRLKEYEREKRLRLRQLRKEGKTVS